MATKDPVQLYGKIDQLSNELHDAHLGLFMACGEMDKVEMENHYALIKKIQSEQAEAGARLRAALKGAAS